MSSKKSNKKSIYNSMTPDKIKLKKKILSKPINQINLEEINSIVELLDGYSGMSVQARNLGQCAKVFSQMLQDKERPTILLGLAGPLIAGGLRKVIRDMIENNLIDVIVSTGAILYQDIYQARGYQHYFGSSNADDTKLRELLIDRIYDTYVDEEKFWETDKWIGSFADTLEPKKYSSREFLNLLAQKKLKDNNSILYTAHKKGIPIFVPALNDSSIGIGLTEHYHRVKINNQNGITIDAIRDNYELTQIVVKSKATASFYVAGGVPKNFINDSVVMGSILGRETGGHKYALQITADSPHWGGLSGSTLKEATSWGKINTRASRAMAIVEPTIALPLLVWYALKSKLAAKRSKIKYSWNNDVLTSIKY